MKERNLLIKKAFEEAAEKELSLLPEEKNILRAYSPDFEENIEKVYSGETGNRCSSRKHRFGKFAVIAAALAVLLTFTTSAMLAGDSWLKILNFSHDPEKYQNVELDFEGAYENDEIFVEEVLEYTGKPVTFSYSLDTGESWEWPDKAIMIYIDGVRQIFTAKTDVGEYKDTEELYLKNEKGAVKNIQFTLEPNIGKKGDEMYLSVVAVFDPEVTYYPQCKGEGKQLFPVHYDGNKDSICDKCLTDVTDVKNSGPSSLTMDSEAMIKIVMKKDAAEQVKAEDNYSALKVSELDKRIYKSYEYENSFGEKANDYDTMEGFAAEIYKDIKDAHYTEWGVSYTSTRIETNAKEQDDFIINLHGATGKYRVSFYVNNEMLPVFNGSYYADVDVVHGMQSELSVVVDTTKLPEGDNYFYVLYEKLDGALDVFRQVDRGSVYTVEIN